MSRIKKVGVIGYGYWGRKLAAKFKELNALTSICDTDDRHMEEALNDHMVTPWPNYKEMLRHSPIDAVAIATPPETHYEITKYCLEAGKHVFCEKPLAADFDEASELENIALEKKLRLQVGYIYLSCNGLMALPRPTGSAKLAIILRNVGGAPSDSTRELIWAGLPHVFSLFNHFFPVIPTLVRGWFNRDYYLCGKFEYDHIDSNGFFEVADFTGIRQRSVRLEMDGRIYSWNADEPNQFITTIDGIDQLTQLEKQEPLLQEIKSFLSGEILTDRIGSRVADLSDSYIQMIGNTEAKVFRSKN